MFVYVPYLIQYVLVITTVFTYMTHVPCGLTKISTSYVQPDNVSKHEKVTKSKRNEN